MKIMKKSAKKTMTIGNLATMMQEGFAGIDAKFVDADNQIDAKFVDADKRTDDKIDSLARMVKGGFDAVDDKFAKIDSRFERLENRVEDGFRNVNARLDNIETDVAEIRKHFIYRFEFEDLVARVKYLETKSGIVSGK